MHKYDFVGTFKSKQITEPIHIPVSIQHTIASIFVVNFVEFSVKNQGVKFVMSFSRIL